MSRSTKKPFLTDQQHSSTVKNTKRRASRSVRCLKFSSTPKSGKAYKKEFCSYDIRDYSFYCPDIKKAHRK